MAAITCGSPIAFRAVVGDLLARVVALGGRLVERREVHLVIARLPAGLQQRQLLAVDDVARSALLG